MKKLFISYAREDSEFVDRLEAELKKNYEVFVDRTQLIGGIEWEKAIQAAIEACDVFLAISSGAAAEKEWTARETLYAESLKKARIPILLEGDVPFRLLNLQCVDFRTGMEAGYPDLLRALKPLAAPTPRNRNEADQIMGQAIRARLRGNFALANQMLARAQAIDSAFDTKSKKVSFWEMLGRDKSRPFSVEELTIIENTSKLSPSPYPNDEGYEWNLSLSGPPELMDMIDHVTYKLHETFSPQQQTVRSRASFFRITQVGWGTFPVRVEVFMKGKDNPFSFEYELEFLANNRVPVKDLIDPLPIGQKRGSKSEVAGSTEVSLVVGSDRAVVISHG